MLYNNDIDLDATIDYSTDDYQEVLSRIVSLLRTGLNNLGVGINRINSEFKKENRHFKRATELLNYKEWVYRKLNKTIDSLLYSELLTYFVDDENSILNHFIEMGLFDADILERFDEIKKRYPNLVIYLNWDHRLKEKLSEKLYTEQNFEKLFKFEDTEADLQNLFSLYNMAQNLAMPTVNISDAIDYLMKKTNSWSAINENVSILRPLTLFAGVQLAIQNGISIDTSICSDELFTLIHAIVNVLKDPIFSDPYKVYYIVNAAKLLGIEFTENIINGLISLDYNSVSKENLELHTTDRLALILLIFKELGRVNKLPETARYVILDIINERAQNESAFWKMESIWGLLNIMIETKSIEVDTIGDILEFTISRMHELAENISLDDVNGIAKIFLGTRIMKTISYHFNTDMVKGLEQYLFNELRLQHKTIPKDMIESLIKDVEKPKGPTIKVRDLGLADTFTSELEKLQQIQQKKQQIKGSNELIESYDLQKQKNQLEEKILDNSPQLIISYLVHPVGISKNYLDKINFNYEAIVNPPNHIYDSLQKLHEYVTIEHLLKLGHHFTKKEVLNVTKPFLKGSAFGEKDASTPDVVSTYYGLSIYRDYNMLTLLDLNGIHYFLMKELKDFNPLNLYQNEKLFLSLKLLEQEKIKISKFPELINKILNTDFTDYQDFNPLLETFGQVLALDMIGEDINRSQLESQYMDLVISEIDEEGCIKQTITDTAKVLITIGLFGDYDRYYEICEQMVNFIVEKGVYFDPDQVERTSSWANENIEYEIELTKSYWALLALMAFKPVN
ncbi:MAG: hypothetical protein JW776_16125 [Candidatus Lokiarchaeota archaeon]|nr:hypothetical protein [Candidatus Lokiarchaeota archaeon]